MIQMVNLALFAPLFLVLLIVGIIYMVSGYKKDFGRSLVSVLATAVAILISTLLAKFASGLLSAKLISKIPGEAFESFGSMGTFAEAIAKGALQIVMAFTLFSVFFIFFLIILKSIGKRIKLGLIEKLNFGTKLSKLGGMFVRAIDAVVVSLFLLMPIYGGVSSLVPTAARLVNMMEVESGEVKELLQLLEKHPVLSAYQNGPTSWVSAELSSFEMNGKNVNVSKIAGSVEGVMERVAKFANAKGDEKIRAYKELNTYLRENVIEEKWSYDVTMAFLKEFEKQADTNEDLAEALRIVEPLLQMSYEDYKKTGVAISDFTAYALDSNFVAVTQKGEYTELPADFTERLGKLMNQSDQLIAVKKMLWQMKLEELYKDVYDMSANQAQIEAARFVDKYYGDGKVPQEQQKVEAEALIILLFGGSDLDVLEALARHPKFGSQVAVDMLTEEFICRTYFGFNPEEVEIVFSKNPALLNTLKNKLKTYVGTSLKQQTFAKYVKDTIDGKIKR